MRVHFIPCMSATDQLLMKKKRESKKQNQLCTRINSAINLWIEKKGQNIKLDKT